MIFWYVSVLAIVVAMLMRKRSGCGVMHVCC
jgi:hypothetical protein